MRFATSITAIGMLMLTGVAGAAVTFPQDAPGPGPGDPNRPPRPFCRSASEVSIECATPAFRICRTVSGPKGEVIQADACTPRFGRNAFNRVRYPFATVPKPGVENLCGKVVDKLNRFVVTGDRKRITRCQVDWPPKP